MGLVNQPLWQPGFLLLVDGISILVGFSKWIKGRVGTRPDAARPVVQVACYGS